MRSALVGTGAIARQHLACLSELPGVEIVGVCDVSRVSAEWAAERYGARAWFTDHREMLARSRPEVVHITSPVTTHLALATDALDAGAHVFIEKPITVGQEDLDRLLAHAARAGRSVIEDYNYLFNPPVLGLLELIEQRALGEILHADVILCLDILGPGRGFVDPDAPHPALSLPGGPIGDFVPHLAALVERVVGAHRSVQTMWTDERRGDGRRSELQALVAADAGSASVRFSDRSRPQHFSVRVSGTEMTASAIISGRRLVVERPPQWRRPLLTARRAMAETVESARAAMRSPWERLAGLPGLYMGMWTLIERTYAALESGETLPVSPQQIRDVNRLRFEIVDEDPGQ